MPPPTELTLASPGVAHVPDVLQIADTERVPAWPAGGNRAQRLRHAAGDDIGAGGLGADIGLMSHSDDQIDHDLRLRAGAVELVFDLLDALYEFRIGRVRRL